MGFANNSATATSNSSEVNVGNGVRVAAAIVGATNVSNGVAVSRVAVDDGVISRTELDAISKFTVAVAGGCGEGVITNDD